MYIKGMTTKTELEAEIERLNPLEAAGNECARGQRNVLIGMLWNAR